MKKLTTIRYYYAPARTPTRRWAEIVEAAQKLQLGQTMIAAVANDKNARKFQQNLINVLARHFGAGKYYTNICDPPKRSLFAKPRSSFVLVLRQNRRRRRKQTSPPAGVEVSITDRKENDGTTKN